MSAARKLQRLHRKSPKARERAEMRTLLAGFDAVREQLRNLPTCWQCGHLESAHLPEEQGCTHPECSCAQVPEQ